jgi:hypothetical protein
MVDKGRLTQRYADLLEPEHDESLLRVVEQLDDAASTFRQLEPPRSVDQTIEQLAARRNRTTMNGRMVETFEPEPPLMPDNPRHQLPERLRSGWARQLLSMVAAVAVLVLFAGLVAALLRGPRAQGGVGAGGAASPSPSPHLPLTITANGVAITLESVDTTATTTRFHITIHLPADVAASSEPDVLGPIFPTEDLQVEGLSVGPPDPQFEAAERSPGQPTVPISITFGSVAPPRQEVTLTLARLRFSTTPTNPQTVEGPWTFHVTSEMLATAPLPTPNHDHEYHNVTLAQAQQLVGFPVIEPSPLPAVLQPLPDYSVGISVIDSARANYVMFAYPAQDPMEKGVLVVETTAQDAVPIAQDGALRSVDHRGKLTTVKYSHLSQSTVSIGGVAVTKLDTVQEGVQVVYYTWKKGGVYFVTYTIPGPQVTEAVFEQMVTSMIAPASTPATPQAQAPVLAMPTPNDSGQIVVTFEQAKQLVSFHLAEPQWLPSYLVAQGIRMESSAPPGTVPSPEQIHNVFLGYGPPDRSQHYSLQILEHGGTFTVQLPNTTVMTIAGHLVTRSATTTDSGSLVYFLWQEQGTSFQITAQIAGPLTEQDVEKVIASMITQGS